MKVSLVGPAYPLRGGIAHHVYWLQRQLLRRQHQVQVISFRKLYPSWLFPGTTERDESRLKFDAGAQAVLVPYNPLTWLEAYKTVKAFCPDIVVFQWWQPFFAPLVGVLARLLKRAGFPCLTECHNVFPHERTPFDGALLRFAFSPVDGFITHSTSDRDDLWRLVPQKPVTVSALPTVEEFAGPERSARDGRTLLFFGKVRKYKGLEVLLAAMPRVLSEIDCRLLVVGEFYEAIERYQQIIEEYGIAGQVQLHNRYVPNEEVPGIFALADVLVLPYLSATQSGVAQIALSNGLPIIASSAGGLADTVKENINGLLFPPQDAEALARQIIHYFSDQLGPQLADKMRAAPGSAACQIIEIIEQAGDRNGQAGDRQSGCVNPTGT